MRGFIVRRSREFQYCVIPPLSKIITPWLQYSRLSVFVHVQTRVCHAFVYDCIPCIRFIRLVIRLHLLYYYYSQMNTCFLQSRTGSRWQSRWSLCAPPFYNSLIYSKAHSFYVLILQNLPGYCILIKSRLLSPTIIDNGR
jgi:hypothetical protein